MGKLITAVSIAGMLFFGLSIAGGGAAWRMDSTRPEGVDAYSYYVDALNATSGADRARVALAYEWAEATGAITEDEYNDLEELYNELRRAEE